MPYRFHLPKNEATNSLERFKLRVEDGFSFTIKLPRPFDNKERYGYLRKLLYNKTVKIPRILESKIRTRWPHSCRNWPVIAQ